MKQIVSKQKRDFSRFLKSSSTVQTYDSTNHSLMGYLTTFMYNSDNFGFIINEPSENRLIGIDFGEFETSKKTVEGLEKRLNANLTHIFSTHGHNDHVGGNKQWLEERPELEIIRGNTENSDKIVGTGVMNDLECLSLGELSVACLFTPGHTKTAVTWVITHVAENSTKIPFLFTGDTVFHAGCGRIFDGTYTELFDSISKLSAFPNESLLFCGHEYTVSNLEFARSLEPSNEMLLEKLRECNKIRENGQFTTGTRLMEEKMYNPFFRCHEPIFKEITGEEQPVEVFRVLREMKDNFKI